MSLTEASMENAANTTLPETSSGSDLRFLPKYLAAKCQRLIETYHAMHGYGCLPDMLWRTEVRDLIEAHKKLSQIFRKSSITRSAKKANEGYVRIATAVLALEVLTSDFAGWGRRYPWAKRKAEAFRRTYLPVSRTRLMDMYLYPNRFMDPALIRAMAPPENPRRPEDVGWRVNSA